MFLLTVFVYPLVLALLCVGAGLLADSAAGGWMPAALLPAAGLAMLVGVSQLATWPGWLAPASPYVVAAFSLSGLILGRDRLRALASALRETAGARAQAAISAVAYLIAIAPVMLSGRASFASYMTLTDSAVHMVGADYLIHHGRDFAHLDLGNSYGRLVNSYFDTGYPSGADTIFGASALLLRAPLIWAFQPFNAFAVACAASPAWLLLRRIGLDVRLAALAALTVTLPALVYAYELIASVKEIVALPMILAIGVLVVTHRRWLRGPPRRGLPFGIFVAAGVSVLGAGFGAWALAALAVLIAAAGNLISTSSWCRRGAAATLGCAALSAFVLAAPTWAHVGGSVQVASTIAQSSNPGNLQSPLQPVQVLGTWLSGSYMTTPTGASAELSDALIGLTALCALFGTLGVLRRREWALAGWIAGALAVWVALGVYGDTWVDAKGLMLTSPVVMLLAWAGVAAVREGLMSRTAKVDTDTGGAEPSRDRRLLALATLLAVAIAAGVLLSDAMQYRASALAPTARYDELASLNARFAGRGPTLFTDFDEYSMYELRALDIGGPDFLYPPKGLGGASEGHGYSVDLERVAPAELAHYPLILTRRNPAAYRPPAAYELLWQGTYYELWGRRDAAPAAIAVLALHGAHPAQCSALAPLARLAAAHRAGLVADLHPAIMHVSLLKVHHPSTWVHAGVELRMDSPGRLWTTFQAPHAGEYELWLSGEAMPALSVRVDGRRMGEVEGEVSGNGDSPDPMVPLRMWLTSGRHRLSISRGGFSLAPGSGASAYLEAILLTPAGAASQQRLVTVPPGRWRSLCGRHLDWVEAVPR